MQYIEAPSEEKPVYRNVLFLAGGISNCPDWQKEVVDALKDLPITVCNPRRVGFDLLNESNTIEQIYWEHRRLREANQILFWFPCETLCPIALFEYGAALERGQNNHRLYVGADPKYQRILDLRIQTGISDKYIIIETSLKSLIARMRRDYEFSN